MSEEAGIVEAYLFRDSNGAHYAIPVSVLAQYRLSPEAEAELAKELEGMDVSGFSHSLNFTKISFGSTALQSRGIIIVGGVPAALNIQQPRR